MFFLEEDHYLAEDAIHMINLMVSDEKFNNDQVNVLSLGSYTPSIGKINNLMNKVQLLSKHKKYSIILIIHRWLERHG